MTEVYLEADGSRYTCVASGHAGSERTCAAVSTLLYTAAGYLANCGAEVLERRLESGDAALEWQGEQPCWDMLSIGFLQLARSYPKDIRAEIHKIE